MSACVLLSLHCYEDWSKNHVCHMHSVPSVHLLKSREISRYMCSSKPSKNNKVADQLVEHRIVLR